MGTTPTSRYPVRWLGALLLVTCLAGCSKPAPALSVTMTAQALQAATASPTTPPTARAEATMAPPTVPEAPTPTPEPSPEPPTSTPETSLAIVSFNCDIQDIPEGKRLTFNWETTGATKARIISGSAQRFAPQWEVPANGSHTVDLDWTYYPNPSMTLIASDDGGNEVRESVTVSWACAYSYFFANPPTVCPQWEPSTSAGAHAPFEHGRMFWLKEIRGKDNVDTGVIIVLYDDGQWQRFSDTWVEGQPESDPSIVPPAGLYQPVRGFGKLWRENADVHAKLGWAKAPEQAYSATWQWQARESLPSIAYLQLADGQVVELSGQDVGSWRVVAP